MHDSKYCYPNSDVLINKLNITDENALFEAEKELTLIRLQELQKEPIRGNFDFKHLKEIHKYIFQDLYDWAGNERTVEIAKGNSFCPTRYISDYANSVFNKYYSQCHAAKNNLHDFVKVFANNYGDLNALHPFREGNGRAQREFARLVCLDCGYEFDLSSHTHEEMLSASVISFNKGDNSEFELIFSQAITPYDINIERDYTKLGILTSDDLTIDITSGYDYYEYQEHEMSELYDSLYEAKILKMDAEKIISEARQSLSRN